jgi:alpha-tubulin suppressor-like RCC1 family protein
MECSILIIEEQRRLYTCGLNTWGQLGLGDTVSRYEPTLIQSFNEQVSQFSCGDSHAAAIVGSFPSSSSFT